MSKKRTTNKKVRELATAKLLRQHTKRISKLAPKVKK